LLAWLVEVATPGMEQLVELHDFRIEQGLVHREFYDDEKSHHATG